MNNLITINELKEAKYIELYSIDKLLKKSLIRKEPRAHISIDGPENSIVSNMLKYFGTEIEIKDLGIHETFDKFYCWGWSFNLNWVKRIIE